MNKRGFNTVSGSSAPGQFSLNAEQISIRDLARSFAAEQIGPYALQWDHEKFFPRDVIHGSAALGFGGIAVAEEMGGSALSRLEGVLIYDGLATACPSISGYFSVHNMVASVIDRFGSLEQRRRWLPRMCTFDQLGAICLTEPASGSDAAALTTRAIQKENGYALTGVKQFISGAGEADIYLVMARTGAAGPRGISAFIVEKGTPGLSFGPPEKKMGWNAQPTCQVILDDVHLPNANLLGDEGIGFKIAMAALDGGRLNIAACSLGGARAAVNKATAYMKERKAFGHPIADFQALQFQLADMATELEVAQTFLWRAASALDANDPNATVLCAMAKRYVTDAGFEIANNALQLFGGYGYIADYGIEKIVRDLRVHQILEGTNEIMRVIIARSLLQPPQ
ncbi:MAG TPA: acyl-CoA dehydrogenase family protein [Terracidiphilus sp.]|nr:acyl-CoA dehydrogenase family protein [Terracidiphilus sp.]